MKILLDEMIPHELRHLLVGNEVFTVANIKWTSYKNGNLMRLAGENGFDVLLTKDTGVRYQQNLRNLPLALLIVRAKSNEMKNILPLVPEILDALEGLKPKSVNRVG